MRSLLLKITAVLVVSGLLGALWLSSEYQEFLATPLTIDKDGETLVIAPGTSLTALSRDLHERGMLERPAALVWMARLRKQANRVQAGEYLVKAGTTPPKFMEQIITGKVVQHALTLVEGWSFAEVMAAVRANPVLAQTLAELDDTQIMEQLGHAGEHPEGRFYPDTYHFSRGTSDVEFLQRAYRAMEERLNAEWPGREEGLPVDTPYEALILASIVEKETGAVEERARIAGVFVRRLQKGMLLQTDPTVIYGMGSNFDGNLRRRDLQVDTPYNTYVHKGLPPTPIAMPGGEAIHAALHPADGKELYFVARGDGSHHFSATLTEHNAAVAKYQIKSRRKAYRSSPPTSNQ